MELDMTEPEADLADVITAYVVTYGLDVLGAVVLLVVGWLAAGWAAALVDRALGRLRRVDEMLRRFFASLVRYLILIVTVLAVLAQFGVQTASLIAVFGAASLAVGLALQGTLTNVAAGVMLLLFRPFKVGDYIVAGNVAGTVKSVTLFITEMATPDNVHMVVPNNELWGKPISNFSHNPTRRLDFNIGISYEDDIDKAFLVAKDVLSGDLRIHAEPAPMVVVNGLGDSSVDLIARVWVGAGDYWGVKFDNTRRLKQAFDAAGITIPYPQRTLHIVRPSEDGAAKAAG